MVQKVEIVIDGKSVELPVLEASEGLNVIDVRGIIKEGAFCFRPGLPVHRKLRIKRDLYRRRQGNITLPWLRH